MKRLLGDILAGTTGRVIMFLLFFFGVSCIISGLIVGRILYYALGILCFCAFGGIRYALGHIIHMR